MAASVLDPRIKLRHVTCFLEVVRLRSVVKAGELLGMSQPAVSKTLKELEEILGVSLFDRSARSLMLSAYGQVFLSHVGPAVAALRQGVDAVRPTSSEGARLAVGALPTALSTLIPAAIAHFSQTPLFCRSRVVTGPSSYLMSLLRGGEIDCLVGRMAEPANMAGLSFEYLYSERIVLVVRPGHPLLDAKPFDLRLLEDYPILMPPPGAIIRPAVESLLLANGVARLRDEVETVSNSMGLAYTRSTAAVWIISESVVTADIALGQLVPLPVNTSATLGPIGITTLTGTRPSPQADMFVRSIRAVVAGRGEAG